MPHNKLIGIPLSHHHQLVMVIYTAKNIHIDTFQSTFVPLHVCFIFTSTIKLFESKKTGKDVHKRYLKGRDIQTKEIINRLGATFSWRGNTLLTRLVPPLISVIILLPTLPVLPNHPQTNIFNLVLPPVGTKYLHRNKCENIYKIDMSKRKSVR